MRFWPPCQERQLTNQGEEQVIESSRRRNWPEIREWTNMATAVAAVILAGVSLWTTARVSDLEDFFQSEIVRRNTDLNDLAARSRSLQEQADRSVERLNNLRGSADRILAASNEAQNARIVAQSRLNDIRYDVVEANRQLSASQTRLGVMDRELAGREQQIDLYRRRSVFEDSLFRLGLFRELQGSSGQSIGSSALEDLRAFGIESRGTELDSYYEMVRRDAPRICRFLGDYNPAIPPERQYPPGPQHAGRARNVNGVLTYYMTREEYEAWTSDFNRWNSEFSMVSNFNRVRMENINKVSQYVSEALRYCVCRALATEAHGSLCSGLSRPTPPNLENLNHERR
jgi:hypothetical protein